MSDDTLARARAAVARLSELEGEATPGPWVDKPISAFGQRSVGMTPVIEVVDDAPGCVWHDYIDDQGRRCHAPIVDRQVVGPAGMGRGARNLAAIVALRNTAPALLRLAGAVGRHFEAIDAMSRLTLVGEGDSLEWDKWSARNREARDDMRAALADLTAQEDHHA